MATVFLSYARDDADHARLFAKALEVAGHSVWWDLDVRGGAQFSKAIEEALEAADVVVVLWSTNSVEVRVGSGRSVGRAGLWTLGPGSTCAMETWRRLRAP